MGSSHLSDDRLDGLFHNGSLQMLVPMYLQQSLHESWSASTHLTEHRKALKYDSPQKCQDTTLGSDTTLRLLLCYA